jgi:hypothetical protein
LTLGAAAPMLAFMEILSERLAYWFLRLNGFLTTTNFIVHREEGMGQHSDVDVLAIRFPNRRENQIRPMQDDWRLVDATRIQLVLAEAKLAECGFNLSWLDPGRGNMRRILAAVGAFDEERLEQVCEGMYRAGEWTDGTYWVRLLAFGERRNRTLGHGALGQVPQFRWREDVLPFIHERFWSYRNEKWYHGQWDDDAKKLYRAMMRHGDDVAGFLGEIRVIE